MGVAETFAIIKATTAITVSTKKIYDDIIKPIYRNSKTKNERAEEVSRQIN